MESEDGKTDGVHIDVDSHNEDDEEKKENEEDEKEKEKKQNALDNFNKINNADKNIIENEVSIDLGMDKVARGVSRYGSK